MKIFNRILKYIKPYKSFVIISLLASLIFVAMNSASVWMVGSLINKILVPDEPQNTITNSIPIDSTSINDHLKDFTNRLIGYGDRYQQLQQLCILLLIIFLIKNIAFYINKTTLEYVQNRLITDIRKAIFKHMQALPLSFFDKNKSAEIQSIFIRDVDAMRTAFNRSIQKLIVEPLNILTFIFLLFVISVKMTLVTLVVIPLSGFFIVKLGQSIRRKARRSSTQIAGVVNVMQEALQGMRIVKAFTMEKFEVNRFTKENNKFFKLIFRQAKFSALSTPINEMIGVAIGVVLLWFGGVEVLRGNGISPEDFMRFILLLFAMMQPAKTLGSVNAQIQAGLASAARVFGILDVKNTITDIENPVHLTQFDDRIEFKNVTFKYETGTDPSLCCINAVIRKGEIVALVGMSGAGKSTFVDLIPRFYDITSGEILLDGENIRACSLHSLRSLMGIVTQETILFNDTIGNNIAYGMPDISSQSLTEAAQAAHALEFIEELPLGFDTIVGEKGARLSGGQRQRISIARAILKNPAILILDEATSALDSEAEQKVQIAIDELVQDRTVIVIAHRLSTIMKADKIIVLDEGKIIETGTHDELLEIDGKYKQLYDLQFKK